MRFGEIGFGKMWLGEMGLNPKKYMIQDNKEYVWNLSVPSKLFPSSQVLPI